MAIEVVFKTLDIVLAKISAGLHLNHFQRLKAWVFESVHGPCRYISRFIRGKIKGSRFERDTCATANHHPMLGTMLVTLKRNSFPRIDNKALDLIAITLIDTLVMSPGPIDLGVMRLFGTPLVRQPLNEFTYILHTILAGHQHRIRG